MQLYLPVTTELCEAVQVLDQCVDSVMVWMRANKLKLNPGKMEALWVSGFQVQEIGSLLVLDRVASPLKDQVCSLGVFLDHHCFWWLKWPQKLGVPFTSFTWLPATACPGKG